MSFNSLNEVQDMAQEKKNSLDFMAELKRIDLEIAKLGIDEAHKEANQANWKANQDYWKANQDYWKASERHWRYTYIVTLIGIGAGFIAAMIKF